VGKWKEKNGCGCLAKPQQKAERTPGVQQKERGGETAAKLISEATGGVQDIGLNRGDARKEVVNPFHSAIEGEKVGHFQKFSELEEGGENADG